MESGETSFVARAPFDVCSNIHFKLPTKQNEFCNNDMSKHAICSRKYGFSVFLFQWLSPCSNSFSIDWSRLRRMNHWPLTSDDIYFFIQSELKIETQFLKKLLDWFGWVFTEKVFVITVHARFLILEEKVSEVLGKRLKMKPWKGSFSFRDIYKNTIDQLLKTIIVLTL